MNLGNGPQHSLLGVITCLAVAAAGAAHAAPPAGATSAAGVLSALKKAEANVHTARLSLLAVRRKGPIPEDAHGAAAAREAALKLPTDSQRREYLLVSGADWHRDITVMDSQSNVESHVILGVTDGAGRLLQETGHAEQTRRMGTVGIEPDFDASDLFLLGRTSALLDDIKWSSVVTKGADKILTGARGAEKVTVTLRMTPRPAIEHLASTETQETPQGKVTRSQDLWATYEVTNGKLTPKSLEHLVYVGSPLNQASFTKYTIEGAMLNSPLKPEEMTISFPSGVKVIDQRFTPPVRYVQGDKDPTPAELKGLAENAAQNVVRVGGPAPEWELKTLAGKTAKLSDYRGKTVILTWFASWCGPCNAEAPHMEREVWQKYRDRGLVVIGVNAGEEQDPQKKAKAFVAEHGVTYPVVLDSEEEASQAYRVRAFPTIAIIDKKGVLRYLEAGFQQEDVIAKVESLISAP